jgi:thiamine-monophosphate kinase
LARGANRSSELEAIARYFRPLATAPGALSLFDDAAILRQLVGEDLVLSADMLVEGIHFFANDPPDLVAAKALRVNLSDLAAKGAEPLHYLLSLALRSDWTESWLSGFAEGLRREQQQFRITLAGGDTVRASGGTTIGITAIGRQPSGQFVHRSGAKPGDLVVVSGTIGDAALGLLVRQGRIALPREDSEYLVNRYLLPHPRVSLAAALRRYASAALDVSDGLVGDFAKLCMASGVTGEIARPAIPLSPAARNAVATYEQAYATALTGGDDYEILATVAEGEADAFANAASAAGVSISFIGRIVAGEGAPEILDEGGQPLVFGETAYSHF